MRVWVGTSGYNYPEWKGSFYPQKMPAAKMLAFYAERFTTVEINYTFYRVPNAKILAGWDARDAAGLPPDAQGAQAHHPHREAARTVPTCSATS